MWRQCLRSSRGMAITSVALALACSSDTLDPGTAARARLSSAQDADEIPVATVNELYAAVNDPMNAGRRIAIAPGTYVLDGAQANGGRLELQDDMTLTGRVGHADSVIIDAAALSAVSLTVAGQATGAIRLGRGSSALQWLTVRNAVNGAAAVTTDLVSPGPTTVTIAHVTATGSPRGFDVRNVGALSAGRVLDVTFTDNVLAGNVAGTGQGLRIANLAGANGARIRARLMGNTATGNIAGCVVANVNTDDARIEVDSRGDRFEDNGNGCVILGGNAGGTNVARRNFVRFSAQTSDFEHNVGPLGTVFPTRAGIAAYGGVSTAANRAFDNRVEVELHSVKSSENGGPDVAGWGAISAATQPAGTGNTVTILLVGSTKKAWVDRIASVPTESAGTNTVTVLR